MNFKMKVCIKKLSLGYKEIYLETQSVEATKQRAQG